MRLIHELETIEAPTRQIERQLHGLVVVRVTGGTASPTIAWCGTGEWLAVTITATSAALHDQCEANLADLTDSECEAAVVALAVVTTAKTPTGIRAALKRHTDQLGGL
jgi:hypothetical protein